LILRSSLEAFIGHSINDVQWMQASFGPSDYPGLGVRKPSETALAAVLGCSAQLQKQFQACKLEFNIGNLAKSLKLFRRIWSSEVKLEKIAVQKKSPAFLTSVIEKVKFDRLKELLAADEDELARLNSCSSSDSTAWLRCIPSARVGTKLDSAELVLSCQVLLGICKLEPVPGGNSCITRRHNALRDCVFFEARKAALSPSLEPKHRLVGSHQKPAGVLIPSWSLWERNLV
jgi:hypothetical protein